jgi:peptidoglycan/LPS O-acetylase OafA/YrhL
MTRHGRRLLAVDAVRGIAALAVVIYHVPGALISAAKVPAWLAAIFAHGALGVDAFFVLSGFVITMSVASSDWTVNYLGRFILRRSVRLDPSYWAAIAIEVMFGYVGFRFLQDAYPFPTMFSVAAHLVYLQGVLRFPQVSDVFWTLCFEIQFYLGLVGSLVVSNLLAVRHRLSQRAILAVALIAFAYLSVAIRNGALPNPHEGLAIIRVYQFAIGIVVYLLAQRQVSVTSALAFIASLLAVRALNGALAEVCVTALSAGICYGSIRSDQLNALADRWPLQFLGKISYSLYLYHASIVGRASAVTLLLVRDRSGAVLPAVGIISALVASIAFSYVMFRLVEAPTMRLSKRVSLT